VRREKRVATLDEIKHVLSPIPDAPPSERCNWTLVAFAILTGARDAALASSCQHSELGGGWAGRTKPNRAKVGLFRGMLQSWRWAAEREK